LSDKSFEQGWDDLFRGTQAGVTGQPSLPDQSANRLNPFLELPGVKGVLRVALEGTILGTAGELEAEQDAALSAFLGAAAGQIGQVLELGRLQYTTIAFGDVDRPMLLLRQPDAFLGMILESGISPTHVISKLQDLKRKT
jgi:predicted regulator of Ras-like GTPase activity (Roadblock/LC7/MglB family)